MNINCEFEKNEAGKYVCSACGLVLPVLTNVNCRVKKQQSENKEPSLAQKAVNFAKAAVAHAAAGSPTVSEEKMKERLAICKSCPLFKPNNNQAGGVCTHSSCGCNVQDNLNYLNKIAWADQECPTGLWGKENIGV
jgi:hypothetical protein